MTKTEELRKAIIEILMGEDTPTCGHAASQILAVCKDAGLVFVDKDAQLPFPMITTRTNDHRYQDGATQQGMKLMLDAGWEKTEEIEL